MDLSKVDSRDKKIETFLGLGSFAPFQYERSQRGTRIRVFWKRSALWLLIVSLITWIGIATSAWLFVKYKRDFPEVRYSHMLLLPWKLDEYRRAKGEFFIARGKERFNQQAYLEAFELMRAGLAAVPEDTEARRFVAELYLALRRPDLAQPLMVGGLPYNAEQLDYLQWVFASLFRFQEDDAVARIAGEFLAAVPDASPNARHIVLMAEATAHFFRGRFDASEAVLARHATHQTQDGQLLLARIALERGRSNEAVDRLRKLLQRHPENLEAYTELISLLRRENGHAEVRRQAVQRQLAFPDHPRAFLDELQVLHDTGATDELAAAFEAYLTRFPNHAPAIEGLAAFVSNIGHHEFARRLYKERADLKLPAGTAALCLIEAQLVAGRYADALGTIQLATQVDQSLPDAPLRGVDALKAVAYVAQGDLLSAQNSLIQYLAQPNLRPELLILTARRLDRVGGRELALQALRKALVMDPLNQAAFNDLLTLEPEAIKADELRQSLPRLLAFRRPPTALLRRLRQELQSDRYLYFTERDGLLQALAQSGL